LPSVGQIEHSKNAPAFSGSIARDFIDKRDRDFDPPEMMPHDRDNFVAIDWRQRRCRRFSTCEIPNTTHHFGACDRK
jgi:hypothetical protein